jgi:RNA polymerase sigma-70 factor (ECF subfamily)
MSESPSPAGGSTAPLDPVATFERHRSSLQALAYRFLGSVADAEDIVQDVYLRWMAAKTDSIAGPGGFLRKIATRLCLDHLKSARVRRERYVGPWLPEPLLAEAGFTTPARGEFVHDVSVALLLALERLSPLERAAFLLSDVFGDTFEEIGEILQRSPATCRQLATRARTHVRAARPRYPVAGHEGERLAKAFERAVHTGDRIELERLLARDAVLYSDGGGVVRAALRPIVGRARITRLFVGLARRKGQPQALAFSCINGWPGFIARDSAGRTETFALETRDSEIQAVYLVRNPEKLRHLAELPAASALR